MEKLDPQDPQKRGTNKDERPKRRYRLTPEGLASLRAAAERNRPWERSTGPRTTGGKARSRMNAWKHGADAAYQRQLRRVQRLIIKKYKNWSHDGNAAIDAEIRREMELLKKVQQRKGMPNVCAGDESAGARSRGRSRRRSKSCT